MSSLQLESVCEGKGQHRRQCAFSDSIRPIPIPFRSRLNLSSTSSAVDGKLVFIDVLNVYGGLSEAANFAGSSGGQGNVLIASLMQTAIDPGYYHFVTLKTESLEAKGCDPSSYGAINAFLVDELVRQAKGGDSRVKRLCVP